MYPFNLTLSAGVIEFSIFQLIMHECINTNKLLSIILILYSILYSNTLHSIVAASLDSNGNGNGVGES